MKAIRWLAVGGLSLGLATSAQALTISGVTVVKNAGNTANFKVDTTVPPDYREWVSTVAITDTGGTIADGVGNNVNSQTQFASTTDADGGALTAASQTGLANYKITFTVSAGIGWTYNVALDTSRLGALTRVDDGTGGGTANIGTVTGQVNGVTNAGLTLAAVTLAQGTGAANTPFSQTSSTVTLTGLTGTNIITLDFSWSSLANSTCTGSGCNLTGNDEMAVRLGIADTSGGATAGDYPGVGSRTIGSDGHFVTVKATETSFIPEPGTVLLLGIGLTGLAFAGMRKRS